jgi:hypothetical protein
MHHKYPKYRSTCITQVVKSSARASPSFQPTITAVQMPKLVGACACADHGLLH